MTPPANRNPLTARRRQILDVIVEHQRSRGYPPSIREIAAKVGLRSPASVKAHLDVLDSAGYLRVDPTRPRAIEVPTTRTRARPSSAARCATCP